jgi:hypothetical protein
MIGDPQMNANGRQWLDAPRPGRARIVVFHSR